jgi:hypothetical protein
MATRHPAAEAVIDAPAPTVLAVLRDRRERLRVGPRVSHVAPPRGRIELAHIGQQTLSVFGMGI